MGKVFNIYAVIIGAVCIVALLAAVLVMAGFVLHALGVA